MSTPTNWPNPERPGVPMFPEQDGAHAIEVRGLEGTDLVYYWHQNGGGWTEYNYQESEDFLNDEEMSGWIYKGPVLTPTQIAEMLAGERERCAKTIERDAKNTANFARSCKQNADSSVDHRRISEIAAVKLNAARTIRNLGAAS